MMANSFRIPAPTPRLLAPYVNAFAAGQAMGKPAADDGVAARVAALTPDARARSLRQAELLANVGVGLRGVAYGERRAVLGHIAPALAARGVPAGDIAAFDPTDEAIDAVVAQAARLGRMITSPRS